MQLIRHNAILLLTMLISISMILITKGQLSVSEPPYSGPSVAPADAPSMSNKPLDWRGCMPQYFPICMKLLGATQQTCDVACGSGCAQLIDKGDIQVVEFE